MKTKSEPEARLLEAVLRDEDWQVASELLKTQALGAFRVRNRRRRFIEGIGSVLVISLVLVFIRYWRESQVPAAKPVAQLQEKRSVPKLERHFLSDEELIASFPPGSCFLAEIDGHKELVFMDPEVEHRFLPASGLAAR